MWGLERNRVVEPVSIVPEYQLLVNPVIGQLWQLSSILKSVIALCAQSLTNMVSSLKPSYTATLDVLTFDRRNGFSGSGEDSGWLRYLKRCFHALPFSLSAVFRLFTNSLLSPFYHSSVLTVSLAQARIKWTFTFSSFALFLFMYDWRLTEAIPHTLSHIHICKIFTFECLLSIIFLGSM